MKQAVLFVLIGFLSLSAAQGQVMSKKAEWLTIKSANLKCWECKERLEKYLLMASKAEMEGGITQMKFNLLQGELRVLYFPDRATPDMIRTAINNAGFDADEEKAEESAYKKLPPICKRAEDGGGPQPRKPCHVPPM